MSYRIKNTATKTTRIRHAPSVPPIAAEVTFDAESTYSFMSPGNENICAISKTCFNGQC